MDFTQLLLYFFLLNYKILLQLIYEQSNQWKLITKNFHKMIYLPFLVL